MRNASTTALLITTRLSLMALVSIAVLAACNGSGANDLRGTAWELASMSGSGLLPGTSITIEFTDEEVSGSAGCNHYGGSYQVSGNSLTISDVFAMLCSSPYYVFLKGMPMRLSKALLSSSVLALVTKVTFIPVSLNTLS